MKPIETPWHVYLVRCRDGSVYTGITNNLEKRIKAHNDGKGGRYTLQRRPVTLIFQEEHADRGSALRREAEIKSWTKADKETAVRQNPIPRNTAARNLKCAPKE